jgi:RHS repeat-associated protein
MVLRHFLACLLVLFGSLGLAAQGYETKFKATGFKPGDVYHTDEEVHVSLTGGSLEVEIPLGPALPGPIPLRPMVHYHGKYSQPLNPSWVYGQAFRDGMIGHDWSPGQMDAYEKVYKRWSPPNLPFGEAHPGHLLFRAGSTALKTSSSEPDLTLHSPSGKVTSYYLDMPGSRAYRASVPEDVAELDALAGTMAPEWDRSRTGLSGPGCAVLPGTPVSDSLGTTLGVRLSGGTTLVFGPSEDRIFRRWTASNSPITSELLLVPHEILQVDKDFITLWRRNRNVYHHEWDPKDVNGTLADYRWTQSVYHPVWIKTRSGFRVDVTVFRDTPRGRQACLSDGGILTGYKVAIHEGDAWFQVGQAPGGSSTASVTFGGMDVADADGGSFTGFTPPRPLGTDGGSLGDFQPGTTVGYEGPYSDPFYWELEYTSASLRFTGHSITYGGLTTSFEWNGPMGLLSRMIGPSGKTHEFTYQLLQGVGTNPRSAVSGISWLWNAATPSAFDFYSMVTRMDILENSVGSAQTRTTTYRWKLPEVDPGSGPGALRWKSPTQGVAQTLPTGETILHIFCPPLDDNSSRPVLELEGRTLLATRQAVAAQYRYASGDSTWESFFTQGRDPARTSWYARERFEGWDLRSWETRLREPRGAQATYLSTNTEPRPTRTLREEQGGPVEVTELDDWDADLGNYAVKRSYILAAGVSPAPQFWAPGSMQGLNTPLSPGDTTYLKHPGLKESSPAGSLAHRVTWTSYTGDSSAALFDREERAETTVILAPLTGGTGFATRTRRTFESGARAHIAAQVDHLDQKGGSATLSFTYVQQPLGLFKVNQLQGVTLSSSLPGTPLSGQVGATYEYDASGRFMTAIHQRGAGWQEREPEHDVMGRPLVHKDPNGVTTTFTWDPLGRLTSISPAPPESGSTITPENTLRKTTFTRDGQTKVHHYNGFGELTGEERTGPGGQVSHKLHGFDAGGRKTYETTWRKGPVADFTEWARPKPGGAGVTAWRYDGRDRVIQEVNANGDLTETAYPTPLQTQRRAYPDIEGARGTAATTFDRDILGRLVKVTDAKGQVTSYAYDAAGRVRRVQQGVQVRTWAYDPFGRLESLAQPESGITAYGGFTVTGKPTWTTYGQGSASPRTVATTFDPLSRPLTMTCSDGTLDQAFVYDGAVAGGRGEFGKALGQLSYSRDRGTELWYTYDGLNGRLGRLDTRVGDGPTPSDLGPIFRQTFGYAPDGLRQSASVDGRTQTLSLEAASRLPVGITHRREDGLTLTVANLTQDGVLWAPTRIDFGNGAASVLGYRPDQQGLLSLSHALPGGDVPRISWTYSYDEAGQLKGDGQDAYRYDALGRLSTAVVQRTGSSQVITQKLAYDTVGNLLSSVSIPDAGALPPGLSSFTFPAGSPELLQRNQLPMAQTGAQYDPQGNVLYLWKTVSPSGPFVQMTYDALGRISTLYDSDLGTRETYAYTPEGLRTRIDVFSGDGILKTQYKIYNDQRQLVSEYEIDRRKAPSAPAFQQGRFRTTPKKALTLPDGPGTRSSRSTQPLPNVRYRNNDGTFPTPTPTLIDHNGPAGAYITYPIGPVVTTMGTRVIFTGATDYGTDFSWDFGDGTPPISGAFDPGSRTTTISHTYDALSSPTFSVTFTVRNTAGGYTQSTTTLSLTVAMPALPVIHSFLANGLSDTATVLWGDGARLDWDVAGATSLRLDPDTGPMDQAAKGGVTISNLQSTATFVLTATNAAGSVTQGVRIRVLPKVQSFSASANPIQAGSGSTLDWNVAGATGISLQEGASAPEDVTGGVSRAVTPLSPTTYTLTASNADGASPSAVVQVDVIPVISAFTATPEVVRPGQSTTLSWSILGADLTLSMDPPGQPVSGTQMTVIPGSSTTYRLTVANSYTSVTRPVTVVLNEAPIIQAQPASLSVLVGQVATFGVQASGSGPLSYQWMKNGGPIQGAISATYTTPPSTLADQGCAFSVEVSNASGRTLSEAARLSVAPDLVPPTVTASETGTKGAISFGAQANDNVGISRVEFEVDGAPVGASITPPYRLSLDSTLLADGIHTLLARAYDPSGNQGSSPVLPFSIANAAEGAPPTIDEPPTDQAAAPGQTATFTVKASGTGPFAYQWYAAPQDGTGPAPIGGAMGSSFTTPALSLADTGTAYTVVVANTFGSVTSAPAILKVAPTSQTGVLVWKRDIVYVGTREVGEIDPGGLHITQVDHLGSPRLLTNRNGELEDEQKYMPFGQYLDGQKKSRKGFTGHEQTDSSGLIYMQARFYAPWFGRFLSPDPARDQHFEETQSWNIYSYVQNDPTMKIDPTGMLTDGPDRLWNFGGWLMGKIENLFRGNDSTGNSTPAAARTVYSDVHGTFAGSGWQNEDNHGGGTKDADKPSLGGYVISYKDDEGRRYGVAHAEPGSEGAAVVNPGDPIGRYASPTNGYSSGPHAHLFLKDGRTPKDPSGHMHVRDQKITTPWQQKDKLHPKPHGGVDVKSVPKSVPKPKSTPKPKASPKPKKEKPKEE